MNTQATATGLAATSSLPELPADLMAVTEVCKLLPSTRSGKRLHVSTVHRWIDRGLLRAWKRRGPVKTMRYVSRADVLAMLECEEPVRPVRTPRQEEVEARRRMDVTARAILKKLGKDKYLD